MLLYYVTLIINYTNSTIPGGLPSRVLCVSLRCLTHYTWRIHSLLFHSLSAGLLFPYIPQILILQSYNVLFMYLIGTRVGTRWHSRLGHCATSLMVVGSILDSAIGIFQYGPGVDSTCNRNEYQEYFLGLKAAGA
jgi:hypothetical protein